MLSLVGQFFLTGGGCWSGVINWITKLGTFNQEKTLAVSSVIVKTHHSSSHRRLKKIDQPN